MRVKIPIKISRELIECQCGKLATWAYLPKGDWYRCDGCVPRGCDCNMLFDEQGNLVKEWLDDDGRQLPCCEWNYYEEGFDFDEL